MSNKLHQAAKKEQAKIGKIIIISGPSGSGKTTLHKELLADRTLKKKLVRSISMTTRPKRKGEKEGRDYLFISERQFSMRKRSGYFLEWKKVFGNYYGTPRIRVEKILKTGKSVVLCIDVKGARIVRRKCKTTLGIFVKTPSLEVLKKRLKKRGSETKASLKKRLAIAKEELKDAKHYQYVVINDNLTKAAKRLKSIVLSEI